MLAPLGWLYGLGAAMRREAYARGVFRPGRLVSPVISVGGLAMGGSMKTSLVLEIARALQNRGGEVGIIGHGYRGRADAPRLVSDGDTLFETACSVGDEAVLVSTDLKRCPVVVGRNKYEAGRLLETKFGRRIVIVDGGFQHLDLARDLDIVCVSEEDLGQAVIPAGPLRERPGVLRLAGVVMTDRVSDGPRVAALRGQRPRDVFSIARADFQFYDMKDPSARVEAPARAFAFCGIGSPRRFLADLASQKVTVAGHRFFRDHHPFSDTDLRALAAAATQVNAPAVVTTAKDAVRVQEWPGQIPMLVMTARLDIDDPKRLLKRIDQAVLSRIKRDRS